MSEGCGKNIDGWHVCGNLEMGSEIVPLCEKCKDVALSEGKASAYIMDSSQEMYKLLSQCEVIIRQNKMYSPDGSRLTYNGRAFGAESLIIEINIILKKARGEHG